eukprot:6173242-Prymnesium_polylepis.2
MAGLVNSERSISTVTVPQPACASTEPHNVASSRNRKLDDCCAIVALAGESPRKDRNLTKGRRIALAGAPRSWARRAGTAASRPPRPTAIFRRVALVARDQTTSLLFFSLRELRPR